MTQTPDTPFVATLCEEDGGIFAVVGLEANPRFIAVGRPTADLTGPAGIVGMDEPEAAKASGFSIDRLYSRVVCFHAKGTDAFALAHGELPEAGSPVQPPLVAKTILFSRVEIPA